MGTRTHTNYLLYVLVGMPILKVPGVKGELLGGLYLEDGLPGLGSVVNWPMV